jgi:hypothetical protein
MTKRAIGTRSADSRDDDLDYGVLLACVLCSVVGVFGGASALGGTLWWTYRWPIPIALVIGVAVGAMAEKSTRSRSMAASQAITALAAGIGVGAGCTLIGWFLFLIYAFTRPGARW